jgi:hypothetical protein
MDWLKGVGEKETKKKKQKKNHRIYERISEYLGYSW